jgi:hypothetical protein
MAQPISLFPPNAASAGEAASLTSSSAPGGSWDGAALSYLQAARGALARGRYAEAREALERAETRLLGGPSDSARLHQAVLDIGVARQALGRRDTERAQLAIDGAMAATTQASSQPAPVSSVTGF